MSIAVGTIDLSLASPETGERLTANVYYVKDVTDGVGNLRPLSIAQLVMAISLQRAANLEAQIVDLMDKMNETSELLAVLTDAEKNILNEFENDPSAHAYETRNVTVDGQDLEQFLRAQGVLNKDQHYVRNDKIVSDADILLDDCISGIEAKMDEKNSFSQQTMIELQSMTNKRDQSYDMISNILKSLGTVMTGIVNNT